MRNARKWALLGAVLIVLFNIGILVGTRCTLRVAQSTSVQTDIDALKSCLIDFEAKVGRLPTTTEGLEALVNNPDPVQFTRWIKTLANVPEDPWGHEYQYIVPAPDGIEPYGIYSFGKDGISNSNGNDSDDFNSWDTDRKHLRAWPQRMTLIACTAIVGACIVGSLSWHLAHRRGAKHPH